MLPLEIQIRTRDMHLQAEFGIAAHWRYKEDVRSCSSSVPEMVEWVRRVVTYQRETLHIDHPSSLAPDTSPSNINTIRSHSDVCPFSYSKQCDHSGPVLVILLENEKVPPILYYCTVPLTTDFKFGPSFCCVSDFILEQENSIFYCVFRCQCKNSPKIQRYWTYLRGLLTAACH